MISLSPSIITHAEEDRSSTLDTATNTYVAYTLGTYVTPKENTYYKFTLTKTTLVTFSFDGAEGSGDLLMVYPSRPDKCTNEDILGIFVSRARGNDHLFTKGTYYFTGDEGVKIKITAKSYTFGKNSTKETAASLEAGKGMYVVQTVKQPQYRWVKIKLTSAKALALYLKMEPDATNMIIVNSKGEKIPYTYTNNVKNVYCSTLYKYKTAVLPKGTFI